MQSRSLFVSMIAAVLLAVLSIGRALAFPPLPASFYGQVSVNGQDVPDNTLVRALIGEKVFDEGRTQTYQGHSVYSLDVRGDDTDTPARDGGVEGDKIQFEVGGVIVTETGVWHGGTNTHLDLTASGAGPLASPPPTVPAPATQTPITAGVVATPSPTAAAITAKATLASDRTMNIIILSVVVLVVVLGAGLGVLGVIRRDAGQAGV